MSVVRFSGLGSASLPGCLPQGQRGVFWSQARVHGVRRSLQRGDYRSAQRAGQRAQAAAIVHDHEAIKPAQENDPPEEKSDSDVRESFTGVNDVKITNKHKLEVK